MPRLALLFILSCIYLIWLNVPVWFRVSIVLCFHYFLHAFIVQIKQCRVFGLCYICGSAEESQQEGSAFLVFLWMRRHRYAFPCGGNAGFLPSRQSACFHVEETSAQSRSTLKPTHMRWRALCTSVRSVSAIFFSSTLYIVFCIHVMILICTKPCRFWPLIPPSSSGRGLNKL